MRLNKQLLYILNELRQANIHILTNDNIVLMNDIATRLLQNDIHSGEDIEDMKALITISNILYNNTNRSILPLEDGVYDLLMVLYKKYDPNYQVGAEPIAFQEFDQQNSNVKQELITPIVYVDRDIIDDSLFIPDIAKVPTLVKDDILINPVIFGGDISKRTINTPHIYPELVGTLDKCKFVLNSQAIERGLL